MVDRTFTGRVQLRTEAKGTRTAIGGVDKALAGIQSRLKAIGIAAAISAAGAVAAGSAKKILEFEKSISDLSAITGATGADLDQLTAASKRIGQTTTLSASQAAEAFKLMASAKPDLLANLDALEATTEQSVILAEAAGLELPAATAALGEALNQFGAGANEAAKFTDVLAAGARLGSSEIQQTSEALKNAGTVANLAGLSFAETNAAIQGLAAGGLKGSLAGSKLRAVLVKLQTQADDNLNPAVVGINTALENLEAANLSVTEKVAIFGEESVATADLLVDQRETVARLSGELENSLGAAYDQASTRTDNLWGDLARLRSVFEAIQINLGTAMLPTLRKTIQLFTELAGVVEAVSRPEQGIDAASEGFSEFEAVLKGLFVTGNIVKNLFDIILETFVGIGRIIGAVMTGSLENVNDAIDQWGAGIDRQVDDIAEFAFRTFEPTAAAALDEANASLGQASEELLEEVIVEPMRRAVVTAGEEAIAEADRKAEEMAAREAEREAARLERLRQSFRTEQEVIDEEWELKNEQLNELLANELITREEWAEKRLALARDTAEREAAIEGKGALMRQRFAVMTEKQKTKFVLGEAIRLTQGVAQNSKTMFKINKIAAIANATINTAEAITTTMKAYPYPINVAMAALTAAAGIAQISAIKSTSFSGGGGGTTPSAAGTTPTINDQPTPGAGTPLDVPGIGGEGAAPGAGAVVNINIDGLPDAGPVPAEMVRNLIDGINEQLGDGVNLDTSPGTNTTGGGG